MESPVFAYATTSGRDPYTVVPNHDGVLLFLL
jgi:hypothetical protein